MYTIQIVPQVDYSIVEIEYSGSTDYKEVRASWREVIDKYHHRRDRLCFISDFTAIPPPFTTEDMKGFEEAILENEDFFADNYFAIVTNDPMTTALGFYLENGLREKIRIRMQLFSSMEAARNWIHIRQQ